MARTSTLRASDTDRDTVADRLRAAAVEGRLEPDELEERLHLALRARTYGDLRRLVADLPAAPVRWRDREPTGVVPIAGALFAVAARVAIVLVAVAVIAAVFAFTAMWWILWAVIWMTMRGRRGHWHGGPAWRPPRARRI